MTTRHMRALLERLNAPSGAGCFLTWSTVDFLRRAIKVLMHLLVLGAF